MKDFLLVQKVINPWSKLLRVRHWVPQIMFLFCRVTQAQKGWETLQYSGSFTGIGEGAGILLSEQENVGMAILHVRSWCYLTTFSFSDVAATDVPADENVVKVIRWVSLKDAKVHVSIWKWYSTKLTFALLENTHIMFYLEMYFLAQRKRWIVSNHLKYTTTHTISWRQQNVHEKNRVKFFVFKMHNFSFFQLQYYSISLWRNTSKNVTHRRYSIRIRLLTQINREFKNWCRNYENVNQRFFA